MMTPVERLNKILDNMGFQDAMEDINLDTPKECAQFTLDLLCLARAVCDLHPQDPHLTSAKLHARRARTKLKPLARA